MSMKQNINKDFYTEICIISQSRNRQTFISYGLDNESWKCNCTIYGRLFTKRTISIWEIHSTKNWWSGIETKLCSIVRDRFRSCSKWPSSTLKWWQISSKVARHTVQWKILNYLACPEMTEWKGRNTVKLFLKALLQVNDFRRVTFVLS